MRVAAIDIGTNTTRLLVADDGLVHVERDSRITRLGQGVDASGELAEGAIQRTLDVVRNYVERARAAGAERTRIAGTSALRDAKNRSDFARAVREATGLELEVLDGASEGRAAYAGATGWLPDGDYVVCDIGGGSTEFITRDDAVSIDVGSVRVRERFLKHDPPTQGEIASARDAIRSALGSRHLDDGQQLVGVAGTITTIAALAAGLSSYDSEVVHGCRLSRAAVHRWAERLNVMSADEIRAELKAVAPGRADVIGAGALICEAVCELLDADEMLVSERDILDGLALELFR